MGVVLKRYIFTWAMSVVCGLGATGSTFAGETVKFALIEPMSGAFGAIGSHALHHFEYMAELANAKGGVAGEKIEILSYDNKLNVQESVVSAQKAIDAGARYLLAGNGSGPAGAIQEFVVKYNERNPGKEVIYLNYSNEDPVLTNEKCTYWQFRFSPHVVIKMRALVAFLAKKEDVKKVYLINQDYSLGQNARRAARSYLQERRPDIEIVGDELHPLAKVNDFAPYIAKIRASGADSVITTNWGPDLTLLLKAAGDAGLKVNWFTYFAAGVGAPLAIKQAGLVGQVHAIVEGFSNQPAHNINGFETEFRKRAKYGWLYPRGRNTFEMVVEAMNDVKSSDPKKVASKLEGMRFKGAYGNAFMRSDDHQLFNDMYVIMLGPMKEGMTFDEEGTGWGWSEVDSVKLDDTLADTTCKMKRPD